MKCELENRYVASRAEPVPANKDHTLPPVEDSLRIMNAIDAVSPAEISRAAAMFGTMKQLRIQLKSANEESLDRAFESHVHSILEKLEERLPSLLQQNQDQSLSETLRSQLLAVEVVMARHGLYDATFQQVVMLCQTSKHLSVVTATMP
jgi:hypothetical protein